MPHFPTASKLAALVILALPVAAVAQLKGAATDIAAPLQALLACRNIAESTQRLACFDSAVARFVQAVDSGEVVVVSRQQANAARRSAFGFNLPSLAIFDRSARPEELNRVSGEVESVHRNAAGKWVLTLVGGAAWEQIDNERLPRAPKQGSKVEVRRAALNSYLMNVDGQRAMRVRRVR